MCFDNCQWFLYCFETKIKQQHKCLCTMLQKLKQHHNNHSPKVLTITGDQIIEYQNTLPQLWIVNGACVCLRRKSLWNSCSKFTTVFFWLRLFHFLLGPLRMATVSIDVAGKGITFRLLSKKSEHFQWNFRTGIQNWQQHQYSVWKESVTRSQLRCHCQWNTPIPTGSASVCLCGDNTFYTSSVACSTTAADVFGCACVSQFDADRTRTRVSPYKSHLERSQALYVLYLCVTENQQS